MIRRGDALVVKGLSPEVSNLLSRVQIPAGALFKIAYVKAKTGFSKETSYSEECYVQPLSAECANYWRVLC